MPLIFSVSGLRGIAYNDLTYENVYCYAQAFGAFLGARKLILGCDTRESGIMIRSAVSAGLTSIGCDVLNVGIVPTPTAVYLVKRMKADGGIAVTASHNPEEYNGLKFIHKGGRFLNAKEFYSFKEFTKDYAPVKQKKGSLSSSPCGRSFSIKDPLNWHIKKIISVLKLKELNFKIGVDAVNGAGSECLPKFLESIGCTVYKLNCQPKSKFPRGPEPTPENIQKLCRLVKKERLDLGFALDPDGDRLAIVDECGNPLTEEYTLVLATDYILSRKRGNVVTNLSTTSLMDYVVKKYKCRLYRTKVGEPNVVKKMEQVRAVIGGEGNGGVIYPRINMTRDAITGAGIILKLLCEKKQRISAIVNSYPKYYMIKEKVLTTPGVFKKKLKKLIENFKGKVDLTDGLKIIQKNFWLHIRPSNTEPLLRIIGEGKDLEGISSLLKEAKKILLSSHT